MGEPPLPEWLMHVTGFAFPWWANLMVHSTILISAGLFAAYAFRSRGAAVQSLILRITLAAVLLSPLVTLTANRLGVRGIDIPLPSAITAALENGHAGAAAKQAIIPRTAPVSVVLPTTSAVPPSAAEVEAYESARKDVLLHTVPPPSGILRVMIPAVIIIWAVVSLVLALRLLFFFLKIQLVRRAADEAGRDLERACDAVADELEVDPPLVLQSGVVHSPFLTGLFRPAVLLPLDGEEGEPVTREVLLHELAHLVRRDCLWNLLSQIAVTVLSIQPLMRVLSCRMEEISDHVCDDFVVKHSPNRQAYARHLFAIAQRYRPTPAEMAIGVGIVAFRSSLGQRVERILDNTRRFSVRAGSGAAAKVMLLGALATILMGFTGFRGPVGNGMADIVKAVSERAASLPADLKAIPVDIIPDTAELKPAPADAESMTVKEQSPVTGAPPSGAVPGESSPAPAADPPALALAVSVPAASSPNPAVSAPVPAPVDKAGGTDTEKPDSASRQSIPAEQPISPAPSAAPAAQADNEPVMELTNKESCIREGNRMLDTANFAAAEKAFMKAAEFDVKDPEVMNLLGKAYYGRREYDKAILAYKSAVAKKSNFADAYYNMGDVYLAQGKPDEAMTQYKAAIRLNPAYARRTRSFY